MKNVSKTKWLSILCITIWGAAIYSNTLRAPFVFDDLVYIQSNPLLKDPLKILPIVELAPSRWIGFFTFALNYYFGQESTLGYHLVNLAIHIGSAISCYWLVLLTFRTPRLKGLAGSDFKSAIALLAGLVFVSHPVQTEAVTYIWQRVECLAAFFYLLSLVSYIQSKLGRDEEPKSSKVKPLLLYIVSCVFAYMSAMTKEIAVTLPAIIILYEIVFIGNFGSRFRRVMLRAMPFLCLLVVVPVLAQKSPIVTKNFMYESPPAWSYIVTQTRVITTYVRLLVWPVNQNLDYDFPLSESLFAPEVLLSTLLIISIAVLGLLLYRTSPLITFGTVWFFVTLAPTSSIFPLPDLIFEHRLYLPLAGFVFVLTGVMVSFRKHWKPLTTIMIIGLLLFSVGTYRRNNIWQNALTLWQDTVSKSPRKARPHVNLATAYIKIGELDKALAELSEAIVLKPDSAPAYENMSKVYCRKGSHELALNASKKAVDLVPNQASAYDAMAEEYMHLGKRDIAIQKFNKALSLNPSNLSARNNLGWLLAEKGLHQEAIAEFQQLLQFDPSHKEAAFNIACVYTLSGQLDRAVRQYQKIIKSKPDFLEAYHNLGILYLDFLNKPNEARKCFEQVLVLNKKHRRAIQIKEILTRIEETYKEKRN
ncbi:MAG: tetratricopeptide repeat protein [Deltaproteobacteria bacterium]|nr:tetratricopeptide repeat protein [Deltaproteobacteria bacterium]